MIEILSTIDWVIVSAAVLLTVVVLQRSMTRTSIADSLAGAPDRVHILGEDALALAVLAYLLAVALLSMVVRQFGEQADRALADMMVGGGAQLMGLVVCLFLVAGRFQGGIGRFMLGGRGGHGPRYDLAGYGGHGPPYGPGEDGGQSPDLTGKFDPCSMNDVVPAATPASQRELPLEKHSKAKPPGKVVPVCVVLSLGLCTLVLGVTERILSVLLPEYTFKAHPTIETLFRGEQPLGVVIGLWIAAAVLAPLAEEVFFRGLLQTYLVDLLRSRWRAIGLASLAFAAVHVAQPHAIPALIALSILIGYAYERTGALLAPIVIHAIFNLKTLIWSALAAT